jgi:hypothetical protein
LESRGRGRLVGLERLDLLLHRLELVGERLGARVGGVDLRLVGGLDRGLGGLEGGGLLHGRVEIGRRDLGISRDRSSGNRRRKKRGLEEHVHQN